MEKQELYRNSAIFLLSSIPEDMSDNDPELNNLMQAVFDKNFIDYKARFARKTITERLEGCSFNVPEISLMESDYIEEQQNKLTSFDLMTLPPDKRVKIRRYLAFLESKKDVKKQKTKKQEKSFPQFIINISDEKKELFASLLRDEFKTEIGIEIRYMIEALKRLTLIAIGDRERASLHRSIEKYFKRDIGKRQAVFPKIAVVICKDNIDIAIDRINPLFLKVQPPK